MRKITFSLTVLSRIAKIQSPHFSKEDTEKFQIKWIEAIKTRLLGILPYEGYLEHYKGPWANTRRIIIFGFKVYYFFDQDLDAVKVRGIKAPRMK